MNLKLWASATGLLTVLALAGCAHPVGGDPRPAEPGPSTDSPLPPRPRDIDVNNLDPCMAFTTDQLSELNVGGSRFTSAEDGRGPVCQWRHSPEEPIEAYLIEPVTNRGAKDALVPNAKVISVLGFPAVETKSQYLPGDTNCVVLLDVADGQVVHVQYDYNGTELTVTRQLACEKARFAAGLAMQTLIDRDGGG